MLGLGGDHGDQKILFAGLCAAEAMRSRELSQNSHTRLCPSGAKVMRPPQCGAGERARAYSLWIVGGRLRRGAVRVDDLLRAQLAVQDGQFAPGAGITQVVGEDFFEQLALLARIVADLAQPVESFEAFIGGRIEVEQALQVAAGLGFLAGFGGGAAAAEQVVGGGWS